MPNNYNDKTLDKLLSNRYVPDAPSNLAHRIVEAAAQEDKAQVARVGLFERLVRAFAIPQPALVFGAVALIMIGIGGVGVTQLENDMNAQTAEVEDDVSLAFYLDDIFVVDEL